MKKPAPPVAQLKSIFWQRYHFMLPANILLGKGFGNDVKKLYVTDKTKRIHCRRRTLYLYHYNLAQSIKLTPGSDPKMTNNKTCPQLICKLLLSQFPFCKRNAPIVEDEWTYRPVRKPSVPNKHVVADASKMCLSW